jgi:hypothetical protein
MIFHFDFLLWQFSDRVVIHNINVSGIEFSVWFISHFHTVLDNHRSLLIENSEGLNRLPPYNLPFIWLLGCWTLSNHSHCELSELYTPWRLDSPRILKVPHLLNVPSQVPNANLSLFTLDWALAIFKSITDIEASFWFLLWLTALERVRNHSWTCHSKDLRGLYPLSIKLHYV